jgi:hypothetical protein
MAATATRPNHTDLPRQLQRAALIVWIVLSVAVLCALTAPAVLPPQLVRDISPTCQSLLRTGRPCPLCGMTEAFISITHGRLAQALEANRASLLLYALFVVNELVILWFVSGRIARLALSRRTARVRPPEGP